MARALLPFHCFTTPAAARVIGQDLATVAVVALRAVVRAGKGFDIGHHQIEWGEDVLAFSCRVGKSGDIVIEFDIGAPGLSDRVISEAEFRREAQRLFDEREAIRRKARR